MMLLSAIVTLVLALVLCFFILKDGPKFVPWLQTWINRSGGRHFAELSDRVSPELVVGVLEDFTFL